MEEIRRSYLERLPSRIQALRTALEALENDDPDAEDTLRRLAHDLRGSGTTLGYPAVTSAAAAAEEASEDELQRRVEELVEVLERVRRDPSVTGKTLLQVEDDPTSARMVEALFTEPERTVRTAGTGEQARAILATERVDLVLLDLVLPDVDGRDLLREIRDDPEHGDVPVVVLSARGSSVVKTECFSLGADDFYEKPFDPDVLVAAVLRHLERGGATPPPEEEPTDAELPDRNALGRLFREIAEEAEDSDAPLSVAAVLQEAGDDSLPDDEEPAPGLVTVGRRLADALTGDDVVGRWDDQELLVLLPESPVGEARVRLWDAVESLPDAHDRDGATSSDESRDTPEPALPLSGFSVGIVEADPREELRTLAGRAEQLLFRSRDEGPGRIVAEDDVCGADSPRVLLAEDDDVVASLVTHRLEREGFEVTRFAEGPGAFEAAGEEERWDLAILDVKLPGMTGFELLSRVRETGAMRDVPVMILTSMGRESDVVRGFELGADDYVLKPFSPAELLARVNRLLRR